MKQYILVEKLKNNHFIKVETSTSRIRILSSKKRYQKVYPQRNFKVWILNKGIII